MKTKPIIFNTEMVRAILEGRKTVTRRVIKPQPTYSPRDGFSYKGHAYGTDLPPTIKGAAYNLCCAAPYKIGDVLYVRESWNDDRQFTYDDTAGIYFYKADEPAGKWKWKPSIHMPKEAARIFLRVTSVKVELLQNMTKEDMEKEGLIDFCKKCKALFSDCDTCLNEDGLENEFIELWDDTIRKDQLSYYSWEANPYVWVIEFEKLSENEVKKMEDVMEVNPKMYELECTRNNVTPREFFNYCKSRMKAKGQTLSSWIENFEDWKNPTQQQEYTIYNHEDWEEPLKEGNKYKPYDWHLFLAKNYNFIMEFEFDDEKRGHGYFYVVEYER